MNKKLGSELSAPERKHVLAAFPARTFRTDFTVEEIETARNEVTVARDAMRAAEWKLIDFGEHDGG